MSWRALRVVWGRLRTDWPFLLACWLLVATATTLVTAGALYADTVELGGVRRALAEADPANQGVLVRVAARADELGGLDSTIRPVLQDSFDTAGADVVLTVRSGSLVPAIGGEPGLRSDLPAGQQLVVLGAYQDIDKHAAIVDGHWPQAGLQPMEAAISERAAAALGLTVGSRLQMADASTPGADPETVAAEVQVVGIWRPNQRRDAYWLGDQLDLDGQTSGSTATRGPVMVASEDLAANGGASVEMRWRALPHVQNLQLGRIDQLRADIGAITGKLGGLPGGRNATVNTKLADVLGTIDRSVAVSRGGVVLVILQFVLLAGYAVLLAGALLVERRRPEVALLRARGARASQVGVLAVAESLAIAIPAAILSPLVALAVIGIIGNLGAVGEAGIISAPSLTPSVLFVTGIAGLACVLVVSLPALVSDVDLAHVRAAIGRPLGRTLAQRIGLDFVLLVVTAIGLFQLQSYGTPLAKDATGHLTIDPVLVAAPALSLAAGALLVIRIVPRLGEIADRLFRRLRGLTLPLASSEVARRPLRYTRTALLVVLAGALATFAATYTSTWADSQASQAAYQAGADIRLPVNPQSQMGQVGAAASLRSQPGVRVASPAIRDHLDVGRQLRGIDALMIDAAEVAKSISLPEETSRRDGIAALTAIGTAGGTFGGIELPAGTRRLGVVVDVALKPFDANFPVQDLVAGTGQGVQATAEVLTADDQVARVQAHAETFNQTNARIVLSLPEGAGGIQPRLLAVVIEGIVPTFMKGQITLNRFETSPSAEGDADWSTLTNAADLAGWSFGHEQTTLTFGEGNDPLTPTDDFFGRRPQLFRFQPAAGPDQVLRLIVSDAFLAQSGTAIGDDVTLTYHTGTFNAQVAATLPNFPSMDPAKPFLLIDRPSLRVAARQIGLADPAANEWWLWTDAGREEEVATSLTQPPFSSTNVISQARIRQSLERDPVALGLVGALLLGSLAAAACAAIGLIVGAIVSIRERRTETALLRALGMSRGAVTTGVIIDNGYLLAFGLPAGIGLGILIGLLVLPHTPLNRTGTQVVPAPSVVVPVEAIVGLIVVGLVLLVVTVLAASRSANRAAIADVLRTGDT